MSINDTKRKQQWAIFVVPALKALLVTMLLHPAW